MSANIENNYEIDINDNCLMYILPEEEKDYYRHIRARALDDKGHYIAKWKYVLIPKEVKLAGAEKDRQFIPDIPTYGDYHFCSELDYNTPCYITTEDFRKDYYEGFLYWKINLIDWRDVYDFLDYRYRKDGKDFYRVLELCAGSKGCFVSKTKHCDSIIIWLEKKRLIHLQDIDKPQNRKKKFNYCQRIIQE